VGGLGKEKKGKGGKGRGEERRGQEMTGQNRRGERREEIGLHFHTKEELHSISNTQGTKQTKVSLFFINLFTCAYIVWVISPHCPPHPHQPKVFRCSAIRMP
jgi:hypothetical protein